MRRSWLFPVVIVVFLSYSAFAETPVVVPPAPNSDATYKALRKPTYGPTLAVNNFVLKRDAATFTLTGTLCFLAPVEGKITGAAFTGSGTLTIVPPLDVEKRMLARLTKSDAMKEEFGEMLLRFTDDTYDEVKKAGAATSQSCPASTLDDALEAQRKKLHYNFSGRLLQDVLSPVPGGFFAAFIKGRHYSGKEVFVIDPHGVSELLMDIAPEEVMFATYDDKKNGIWAAFHLTPEYATGEARGTQQNAVIRVEKQQIDTSIEEGGRLTGKTTTTFVAQAKGVRVVPLSLFRTLRVQSVTDASHQQLNFIQEDKDDDPDFFIILPKPLASGEHYAVTTAYSGKEAVLNSGSGNYYPVARDDWYPSGRFSDYATYDMQFAVPKAYKMVATGTRVREVVEGSQALSTWKTDAPQTVAGFHFGKFKQEQKSVDGTSIETYANAELPDDVVELQHKIEDYKKQGYIVTMTLGTMSTVGMAKKAMAEAELSSRLYKDYFGPTPFNRLAMTQQVAMNYGQSWPQLVWLPMSYFYDSTIRHQLGMDDTRGYFKVVGPHEIAHQWWGHTVAEGSYRDQWMSEGFAEQSASMFIQMTRGAQEFTKFWDDERTMLLEKNKEGFRAIDVGPLTLGYRLATTKTGFDIPRRLIYPKGAYVLHMIRMMLWNPKTNDDQFKELMRDYVKTYTNRPATTEDFKAMVEKHMAPYMNLTGNGKLDWFFNEYVYGTALPSYKLEYNFTSAPGGQVLSLKIQQSNVDESFRMLVPVYLELADNRVVKLGTVAMTGNSSRESKIPLAGLKEMPKRAILNYYDDVLCDKN